MQISMNVMEQSRTAMEVIVTDRTIPQYEALMVTVCRRKRKKVTVLNAFPRTPEVRQKKGQLMQTMDSTILTKAMDTATMAVKPDTDRIQMIPVSQWKMPKRHTI